MALQELTNKLQILCHDGHSLDEVNISIDGKSYSDIEVRRVVLIGKEKKKIISLVAWRR